MRIMAIDYGDVRTGLAVSDLLGFMCGEAWTVEERSPLRLAGRIAQAAREREVGTLVLGLPKNMDGSEGTQGGEMPGLQGAAGGGKRPAGGAVGRAAQQYRGPCHTPCQREKGEKTPKDRGRRGGQPAAGGLPGQSEKVTWSRKPGAFPPIMRA